MRRLLPIIIVGILLLAGGLYFALNKSSDNTQSTTPPSNETVPTEEKVLAENCKQAEIPLTGEKDTMLDPERRMVTVRWFDAAIQTDRVLVLPYHPETNFAGCSESAKAVLRGVPQSNP